MTWAPPYEVPPEDEADQERQYLTVDVPQSSIAAGGTEEVEVATGLDLGPAREDNYGMRVLGLQVEGVPQAMINAMHLADTTSDNDQQLLLTVQTRTGDFTLSDPECIYQYIAQGGTITDGTNIVAAVGPQYQHCGLGEHGDVVVSPQLILELQNGLDTTLSAEELQVRMAYTYVPLDDDLFRELLEKHADLFLA